MPDSSFHPRPKRFEHYQRLVESMPVGVFIGQKGQAQFVNDYCARLAGLTVEESLGQGWTTRLHPEDRASLLAERAEKLTHGEIFEREYRFVHADGSIVWVWGRTVPITSAQGDFGDYVGSVIDITHRKQAEQALRNSEATYRSVVAALTEGIIFVGPDGKILDANQSAERILGVSRGELLGRSALPWDWNAIKLDGSSFPLSEHPVSVTLQTGEPQHDVILGIPLERRELIWISINSQPLFRSQDPKPYAAVVSFTDISGWIRQDRLREGLVKVLEYIAVRRPLPEIMTQLIEIVSQDQPILGTVYRTDLTGERLHALDCQSLPLELQGLLQVIPIGPEMGSCGSAAFHKRPVLSPDLLTAPQWSTVADQVHSQGLRACWSYPIIASDDRVLGTFGFYSAHPGYPTKAQTDLFEAVVYLARLALEQEQGDHDRRLMEQQLLQSQKFESLGVLTGGIAHDFNNLLTAILGATGIVLTELSPHSQLRVWMSQIQNAALQASDLARQMLIYSGQSQPEHQPLDLNVMIESMRHLLQLSVHKKSQIEWELGENLPLLSADPTQLRQILMNLVINASDALNQGPGTIQIRTSLVTAIDTNLSYAICQPDVWETEYLCLMVRDTGCGMTPETRVRIFDPFFTTKFTGRGLGLAAVLGVIRMHHGAILLESEVDHGTTFRLLFPASKLPPPVRTEEQVVTPVVKPPQTMRILVVDDEVLVREVISATLQRNGAHTEGVCDGESAISRLTDGPEDFDLVLLDWKMPGCDGIETMQLLRQINPQLPIILMTGSTDQEVSQRLGTQQPSALLKKPFLPRQLQKTVQQVLQPYTSS